MSARRVAGLLGALVLGVSTAACAGIPTGGPVQQVREDDDLDESTVVYQPTPPSPGASAQQVVAGYLDAMLAYPLSTGVAEQYLTDEAARRWNPAEGTHVYTDPEVSAPRPVGDGDVRVELTTSRRLDLDPRGRFAAGDGDQTRGIVLQRVGGEWRIAEPPDGLLVTEKFYEDYFRPFDLYFFDEAGDRLVPSLVHLPVGDQLATALVASLARGPSDPTAQLRTYVPPLDAVRPSVPVDGDGVAEVDLGAPAAELSLADQGRLAAQLVHTLRQVREVGGVRVVSDGTALSPRGQTVQPVDSWARYVPRPEETGPFGVVGRRVVQVDDDVVRAAPTEWDVDAAATDEVVVGPARVASVARTRDEVVLRTRAGADRTVVAAADVVETAWLPDDVLLVLDRPGEVRVRAVARDSVRDVRLARGLADTDLTSFALSPDGARYAATTADSRVVVGSVVRGDDDEVVGLGTPLSLDQPVREVGSVGWTDGSQVAFLGASDLGRQVYQVLVDGSELTGGAAGGAPVLPDVGSRILVVAGERRWAVDARNRLWYLGDDATWSRVETGGVRSLSPGP